MKESPEDSRQEECWDGTNAPTLLKDLGLAGADGHSFVIIRDPSLLVSKLERFRKGGNAHLRLISDFDYTLTRFRFPDGSVGSSSYGVLETTHMLPDGYRSAARELKDFYYPLEVSHTLEKAEKARLMEEWWTRAHDLLAEVAKVSISQIRDIVSSSHFAFRGGCVEFFEFLANRNIPIVILSAGVGDIIDAALELKIGTAALGQNVAVVSNYLEYDASGACCGVKDHPILHTLNKIEQMLDRDPSGLVKTLHSGRENVLLLGDSLGDLTMADYDVHDRCVISIGFLNDRVEERRQEYARGYDIVLVGDHDLTCCTRIIQYISRT